MSESFVKDIALVLGVAAVTSLIARRFRLPPVLGYMIAGLMIGPYLPIPLLADHHRVETLSEFGVILVMFAVGLEFRIKRFFQVLPTSGLTAAVEISVMALSGTVIGNILGWTNTQSIFMGGALAISSTMIVSKVFEESPPEPSVKKHIYGVLVIQDIVAIILLAVLGAVAAGSGVDAAELMPKLGQLLGVLIGLVVIGIFIVPRFIRAANRFQNSEVSVIVATGICFSLALIVEKLGFSVALGAFLAGVLVSESGEGGKIERLTKPLKDVFSAVFFVSIGMTVDPLIALKYLPTCLAIAAVVILLQFFSVSAAGITTGVGFKKSLLAGLSLGQIGEFAFIIAAIGNRAEILPPEFQAIIVTVAVLTSVFTPILWDKAPVLLNTIDGKMPYRLRMMIALYEKWFNQIRNDFSQLEKPTWPKRVAAAVVIDIVLLAVLPAFFFELLPRITRIMELRGSVATVLISAGLVLTLIPVIYSLTRNLSRLISFLVETIFPKKLTDTMVPGNDSARRLFRATLQALLIILVGAPVMAGLKPLLDYPVYTALMAGGFGYSVWLLWKSAGKVETEIESGGEKILQVLSKQSFPEAEKAEKPAAKPVGILDEVSQIEVSNPEVIGKSLAELNIRAATGATVVAIQRNGQTIFFPSPHEVLLESDILQMMGDRESKRRGMQVLRG